MSLALHYNYVIKILCESLTSEELLWFVVLFPYWSCSIRFCQDYILEIILSVQDL